MKFEILEKLYFRNNEIRNIDILENYNLKELKELNLENNCISIIKISKKNKIQKIINIKFK